MRIKVKNQETGKWYEGNLDVVVDDGEHTFGLLDTEEYGQVAVVISDNHIWTKYYWRFGHPATANELGMDLWVNWVDEIGKDCAVEDGWPKVARY